MSRTIHLDIVSAEKQIFSGLVELVVANGEFGELGITSGHAPLLTSLKPGEVRLNLPDGTEEIYFVRGGLLEVQPRCVTVLSDVAERADSLDEAAALAAKDQAEARIASKSSDVDYAAASAELARAIAELRTIRKIRKKFNK